MKAILTHVGAWAPMAEQKAVAAFLGNDKSIDAYLHHFRKEVEVRLRAIYNGFLELKKLGLPVNAIAPEGAIYLTIQIDLKGKKTAGGKTIETQTEVTSYLLDTAKLALVPFSAFGATENSSWYRLSVGTCKTEEIPSMLGQLKKALEELT